jgi:hypothetical protein
VPSVLTGDANAISKTLHRASVLLQRYFLYRHMCVTNWDVSLWWLRYQQTAIQLRAGAKIFVLRRVHTSSGVHPSSYPVSVSRALSPG